jgi:rRNA processing protein Gar1
MEGGEERGEETNDPSLFQLGDVCESKEESSSSIHVHGMKKKGLLHSRDSDYEEGFTLDVDRCNHNVEVVVGHDNVIGNPDNMLSEIITTPSKEVHIAVEEKTETSPWTTNDHDGDDGGVTSMTEEESGSLGSSYLGSEGELKLSESEEEEEKEGRKEYISTLYSPVGNEEERREEKDDEITTTLADINDRKLSAKQIPHEHSDDEEEGKGKVEDEEDDDTGAVNCRPPRSKHEVTYQELPIEPLTIEILPEAIIVEVGYVQSIVDDLIVIQSTIDHHHHRALDVDSVLCFEDRTVLGRIFETFGPVRQPLYSVRLDSSKNAEKEWVLSRKKVYSVPDYSQFVSIQQLEKRRGCDASNRYDEELPEEEQEFSDDEKEAIARKRKTTPQGKR